MRRGPVIYSFFLSLAISVCPAYLHAHENLDSGHCEVLFSNPAYFAAQSQARATTILLQVGKTQETLTNPWSGSGERRHREDIIVRGTPEGVKLVASKGRVFRHYIREKANFDSIRTSKVLLSGPIPYVQIAPDVFRKSYFDLSGVFFTTPERKPGDVGLSERNISKFYYVDVRVPEDFPVLEIEKDGIYLVPLRAGMQDWIRNAFRDWKAGKPCDPTMIPKFQKMDAEGGVDEIPFVPITIVGMGNT